MISIILAPMCNHRSSPGNGKNGISFLVLQFFVVLLLLCMSFDLTVAQSNNPTTSDEYPYGKFSPSMAVIVIVLISALFFMGFFSIYIRHCSQANIGSVRPRGSVHPRRAAATHGLDPSVIETFPLLEYSEVKTLKIGDRALECAVCLCEFEDGETLRLITKCDHVFHPECIDAWFASHTTCPVCRANLLPETPESEPIQLNESGNGNTELDIEAQQNNAGEFVTTDCETVTTPPTSQVSSIPEPQVIDINQILNRNRTRRIRSDGQQLKFPRSHSTGHSLVHPGEDTERFTLRLPAGLRQQVVNRELNRTRSLLLAREGSTRRGYRLGGGGGGSGGEGSSRGKLSNYRTRSDGSKFTKTLSFLSRTLSVKSPKVVVKDDEETATRPLGPRASNGDSARPPV